MKKIYKELLIISAICLSPLVLIGIFMIIRILMQPHVEINDAYWAQEGNVLIIEAKLASCQNPCQGYDILVNDILKKAVKISKEDGTFEVMLPKEEIASEVIKVAGFEYNDYFGNSYIRGDSIMVPIYMGAE